MNAEQAKAVRDMMVTLIEGEAKATEKVFRAVTDNNYKPDGKSRSAWELSTHMAMADIWFVHSIKNGAFAWTGEPAVPSEMKDGASVAEWHKKHLADGLSMLRAMSAEDLLRPVDFFGTSAPAVSWLGMMNNHSVHHRGQLASYLRPMGSKVPAIYGMSADEPMQMG